MEMHIVKDGVTLCGIVYDHTARMNNVSGVSLSTYKWAKRLHVRWFQTPENCCVDVYEGMSA